MSLTKKTTHVTEALANLIEQFKDKENLRDLIEIYVNQLQLLENTLDDVLKLTDEIDAAFGQQLDNLGQIVGEERFGRTDAQYRLAIKTRILINLSSGTSEELIAIVETIIGTSPTVAITEAFPASFDITIDTQITDGRTAGLAVASSKPAGVGSSFRWFEGANEFRFDTAGQGFDQGELGEAISD